MKKLICSILLALLVGCSPANPTPSNEHLNAIQIQLLLRESGIKATDQIMYDSEYGLVTTDWLENTFADQFRDFTIKENIWAYRLESNDCDNFADWARLYAQKLNNETKNQDNRALAFGVISYVKDGVTRIGHTVNFGVVKANDKYQVVFFEPQSGKIIQLSKTELASCISIEL